MVERQPMVGLMRLIDIDLLKIGVVFIDYYVFINLVNDI